MENNPVGRCPKCGITVFYSSDAATALCTSCKRFERVVVNEEEWARVCERMDNR